MGDWSDDIHAVFLELYGYMNRPEVDQAFLTRAGVKLDRALLPLLTRIGRYNPIGVVELAGLVGLDHSTISRQAARLEAMGLVKRRTATGDKRIRLLTPTAAGWRMLDQFAMARRTFFDERVGDWKDEERAALLALLHKFSAALAGFETEKPL